MEVPFTVVLCFKTLDVEAVIVALNVPVPFRSSPDDEGITLELDAVEKSCEEKVVLDIAADPFAVVEVGRLML